MVKIFSFLTTAPIAHDEIFVLARLGNQSLYPTSLAYELDPSKTYTLSALMSYMNFDISYLDWKADFGLLIQKFIDISWYYLQNFVVLSNHPPLPALWAKLCIFFEPSIYGIRIMHFIAFLFLLPAVYFLQRELGLRQKQGLLGVLVFSAFSLSQAMVSFGKIYALILFFAILMFSFFLRAQKQICYLFFAFLFGHLAFMSHYMTAVYLSAAILLYTIFDFLWLKNDKKFLCYNLAFLLTWGASLFVYLPIVKAQAEQTGAVFEGTSLLWREIYRAFKNIVHFYGLNYISWFAFGLFALIVMLWYFTKAKIENKKLFYLSFLLSLVPFISILAVDLVFQKHFMLNASPRYFLFALPFVAVILLQIFYPAKKLFYFVFVPLLAINLFVPALQEDSQLDATYPMAIDLANKRAHKIQKGKLKSLKIADFDPRRLIMLKYLDAKLLDKDPLKFYVGQSSSISISVN